LLFRTHAGFRPFAHGICYHWLEDPSLTTPHNRRANLEMRLFWAALLVLLPYAADRAYRKQPERKEVTKAASTVCFETVDPCFGRTAYRKLKQERLTMARIGILCCFVHTLPSRRYNQRVEVWAGEHRT
jgi:hypothetical protein